MIKINLLRERTVEAPVVRVPTEPRPIQAILIISVLVIASLAFGIWYWYSTYTEMQEKQVQKRKLEDQFNRLEKIRQEVEEYKRVNEILRNRTNVIEQLKRDQSGPVVVMNALIQSLPSDEPLVWFDKMVHAKGPAGDTITIQGRAFDIYAVMDFFGNLSQYKDNGTFSEVELKYYEKTNIPLKFEIVCTTSKMSETEE
jgi:Tfp pilus assembly protein PilN